MCIRDSLNPGHYTVEVFATRFTRAGERVWKGEKLYKDLVYFDGRGVTEIWVDGRDNMRPERPGRPEQGEHRPGYGYNRVMNDQLFQTFYKEMKNEPFKDDRMKLLNAALAGSDFTSDQCLQPVSYTHLDVYKRQVPLTRQYSSSRVSVLFH